MQWYYERDGQQVGPVSQTEMVRLIIHRHIQPHTLVWHPGFGDEWRPASRAGFTMPPPGAKVLFSTIGKPHSAPGDRPAGPVSSMWAWVLLLPGLIDFILLLAGQQTGWTVTPYRPATAMCVLAILFVALVQDRRALVQAGVRPPSFWWCLFLPGYYWCRRRVTGRGTAPFVFVLLLCLASNIAFLADPPPDVQSMLGAQDAGRPAASAPGKAPDAPAAGKQDGGAHDEGQQGHDAAAPANGQRVDL